MLRGRVRGWLRLAPAIVLCAACGGDDDVPVDDAGTGMDATGPSDDAGPHDAGTAAMDATPADARTDGSLDAGSDAGVRVDAGVAGGGMGFVVTELTLAPEGHSLAFAADMINPLLEQDLHAGTFVGLAELLALDDLSAKDDPAVALAIYEGIDPDFDPTNNLILGATLQIARSSVDDAGRPRALLTGSITSSHLMVAGDAMTLNLSAFDAIVDVRHPSLSVDVVDNAIDDVVGLADRPYDRMTLPEPGKLDGAIPAASLEGIANRTGFGADMYPTLLRLIVGFFARMGQPDTDLDGDGLERITMSGGTITSCRDGDGTTIAGETCVLDPRIADGYFVEFRVRGLRAVLLPPAP